MPDAVIFDLDGLLLESEQVWNASKHRLTTERGGRWRREAEHAMLGMSSPEWSRYMHDELALPLAPEEISSEVVKLMIEAYERELPLLPGSAAAGRRGAGGPARPALAARARIGLEPRDHRHGVGPHGLGRAVRGDPLV